MKIKLLTTYLLPFLLLFCCAASQQSCTKKKRPQAAQTATEARSTEFLTKKMAEKDLKNVQRLHCKAQLAFENEGNAMNATANMIWVKDSMLWLNVKKFGIEAARVLIDKDSMYILNRLEKTVTVKSWDWIKNQYHLPEGFPLLEYLILDRAWLDPEITFKSDIKDGQHRLLGKNSRYLADYRIEEGTFSVRQMTFLEQNEAISVIFGFDRYEKLSNIGNFPYLRRIDAFSPETGAAKIELELYDVEINQEQAWRFEIPDHYKRVE